MKDISIWFEKLTLQLASIINMQVTNKRLLWKLIIMEIISHTKHKAKTLRLVKFKNQLDELNNTTCNNFFSSGIKAVVWSPKGTSRARRKAPNSELSNPQTFATSHPPSLISTAP